MITFEQTIPSQRPKAELMRLEELDQRHIQETIQRAIMSLKDLENGLPSGMIDLYSKRLARRGDTTNGIGVVGAADSEGYSRLDLWAKRKLRR